MSLRRRSLLALVAIATAACGDDDPVGLDIPSFQAEINDIFQRNGCASGECHGAVDGPAGLHLTSSAPANYTQLVDVEASQDSSRDRVEPGNAEDSYLVIKLEGRQTIGQRMPIGMDPLDAADLADLKAWINAGAPNN